MRVPYVTRSEVRAAANNCQGSVCFRLVTPVLASISARVDSTQAKDGSSQAGPITKQYLAIVPDPLAVGSYNIRRGPCIDRNTQLSMTDGVVTKVDLNKPSEILNCLSIPLDVGKAIASVPGALLTIKVNQAESEIKYLQAQKSLLEAQAALLAAQVKYAK